MKSLLVHIADRGDLDLVAEIGFDLARRLQAHLAGLHAQSSAAMPAAVVGRGASPVILAEQTETGRKLSQELADGFLEAGRRHGLACEWRIDEGDPLEVLAHQSCFSDLILSALQHSGRFEERLSGAPIGTLPMRAACPVLLVPSAYTGRTVGQRILIAWKCEQVCARALRDATPLLQLADEAVLLSIGGQDLGPLSKVAAMLKRKNIKVRMRHEPEGDSDAGAEILAQAQAMDADMIVMGAYGHSRLRELVLGGATRRALNDSQIPLLMSH
jgi:nucleotide-binding universal stress UspA family protein